MLPVPLAQFCDRVGVESFACKVTLGNTKKTRLCSLFFVVQNKLLSPSQSSHCSHSPLVSHGSSTLHFPLSVVHTAILSLPLLVMNKNKKKRKNVTKIQVHTSSPLPTCVSCFLWLSAASCGTLVRLLSPQIDRCDVRRSWLFQWSSVRKVSPPRIH